MNDIEIASLCTKKDILTIAKELGLDEDSVIQYGKYKAKIKANDIMKGKNGKLILVTAINPTPYGEGKTTVSIGLTDALRHIDEKAIAVLREMCIRDRFLIEIVLLLKVLLINLKKLL